MAEMSRTCRGELVHGVFHLLAPHPDDLPATRILERLATAISPTDFEHSTYPRRPDICRDEEIVRWSTINEEYLGTIHYRSAA